MESKLALMSPLFNRVPWMSITIKSLRRLPGTNLITNIIWKLQSALKLQNTNSSSLLSGLHMDTYGPLMAIGTRKEHTSYYKLKMQANKSQEIYYLEKEAQLRFSRIRFGKQCSSPVKDASK